MRKFRQLIAAARALGPEVHICLLGTQDEAIWICRVSMGHDVVLFESPPGLIDAVVDDAAKKLKGMSQKMRAVLSEPDTTPPSKP